MKVKGKGGISATIIQDSISVNRITTFELEYPRFIHSELMTHRMFSRNAASSRAIPVEKMHTHILDNPATPIHWGKNQPGMSAKEELTDTLDKAKSEWRIAMHIAIDSSKQLLSTGLHKQLANRVTEPFQMMKTVVTATEWSNWFWLRNHEDAQPEIHELARCMLEAYEANVPMPISTGEWHVPYVNRYRGDSGLVYLNSEGAPLTMEDAKITSASCCAQVSYRNNDNSLEKAKIIFDKLINSVPCHASPVEHQATPITNGSGWPEGVTHMKRDGSLWSGNLQTWIQFRQLIPNNSK